MIDPKVAEQEVLIDALREHRVRAGAPPPAVVYTWTTAAQIDELRKTPKLLTRSVSKQHGPDYFQRVLHAFAKGGDELAIILTDARFKKARFGWYRAWPTLLGYPKESYGEHLVRVTLRKEALFAELSRSTGALGLVTLDGRAMSTSQARFSVDRIAGVIFTNDVHAGQRAAPVLEASPSVYREIVLMNEAMIESWEIGTPAVKDEIHDGLKVARRLAEAAKRDGESIDTAAWIGALPRAFIGKHDDTWRGHFAEAMSLSSELYVPNAENLARLVERLGAVPADPPMVHAVKAVFPPGPVKGLPPPPPMLRHPRRHGTF